MITDLSSMAADGPWVTSQAGWTTGSIPNSQAMTGPGSPPAADPAGTGAPAVTVSDHVPVGTPPGRITTA